MLSAFGSIYFCCEKITLKYGLENVNSSTDFSLTDFCSSQSHFNRLKIGRIKKSRTFPGVKHVMRELTKIKNAALFLKNIWKLGKDHLWGYITHLC